MKRKKKAKVAEAVIETARNYQALSNRAEKERDEARARVRELEAALPLGHEFDVFGDGQDACGITYCGRPRREHEEGKS